MGNDAGHMGSGGAGRAVPASSAQRGDDHAGSAGPLPPALAAASRLTSLGLLAAGLAHEINAPLASVVANVAFAAEQLAGDAPLAEVRAALRDALDAADHARLLSRDVMAFARDERREHDALVDVRDVIASTLRLAAGEPRLRSTILKMELGVVPPVRARAHRLEQVFLNLVLNAAQALPERSQSTEEIRICARADGARVVVEVQDRGCGMTADVQAHLFEPFFTTKPIGTGLGLAISRDIVVALGGTITVDSAPGRGTTVTVTVPAAGP